MAEAAAEAEAAFVEGREAAAIAIPSGATWKPQQSITTEGPGLLDAPLPDNDENSADEEEPLEDVEHLQLTPQEAFFLIWNFDCLSVLDPLTVRYQTVVIGHVCSADCTLSSMRRTV